MELSSSSAAAPIVNEDAVTRRRRRRTRRGQEQQQQLPVSEENSAPQKPLLKAMPSRSQDPREPIVKQKIFLIQFCH
jgi:hypothetical protein